MKLTYRISNQASLLIFGLLATSAFATTSGQDSAAWSSPEPWLTYTVIIAIFIISLISLTLIRAALSDPKWSLADALSEEVEVTALTPDGAPRIDSNGKPIMITEMRASTSRMIALMGMIIIMLMFLAFGIFCIFSFAGTGNMPKSTDDIIKFLSAGLTLFAPYLVNKFSSIFSGLSPKPR